MQTQADSKLTLVLKTLIALLAAAIVAAIVVAFVFTLAARSMEGAGVAFIIALAFTAAHAFILGGPLLLVGIALHAVRWWSCLLAGFLIGFVPSALVSGSSFLDAWPMGALGAIGGLTFWLLWRFWVRGTPATPAAPPTEHPASADG